jgi:hypothetical protein
MADITKSDIKKGANTEIKAYMNSGEFKSKVEKIVKDRIKNEKELEDKIVDITKNVISQLYKALWLKRSVLIPQLKNSKV